MNGDPRICYLGDIENIKIRLELINNKAYDT